MGLRAPLEERFWSKVDRRGPNECWNWTGAKQAFGYGVIGLGSRRSGVSRAHRVSWQLHNGELPVGKCLLHSCDNPSCVNPAHLSIGTLADNNRDMIAKRRNKFGERHPDAKLTEAAVREIRASNDKQSSLAKRFGVCPSHISRVKSGEEWRHVEGIVS